MELRELRAFTAVAEELNFNRAAERLNMTQPPLTRLIRKLEHSLGVELFQRTTRRVVLTAAGERLMKEAIPLLQQADSTARAIRHDVADRSGKLVVGSTALAFMTVLPDVLSRFRSDFPETEVDVRELPTDKLVSDLVSAEIDVAFLLLPQTHDALEIRSLLRKRMRMAVSKSHPLADKGPVALSAFAEDKFIMHLRADAPAMYDEIVRCCSIAGFRPKMIEKGWNNTCTGLVAADVGVHFVASKTKCVTPSEIAYVEIEDPAPILELGIAWRKTDPSERLAPFKRLAAQFAEV